MLGGVCEVVCVTEFGEVRGLRARWAVVSVVSESLNLILAQPLAIWNAVLLYGDVVWRREEICEV